MKPLLNSLKPVIRLTDPLQCCRKCLFPSFLALSWRQFCLLFFRIYPSLPSSHCCTGHEHVGSQHREPFESSAVDLRRLSWTRDLNKLLSSRVQHCTGAVALSCPRSHTSFIYISRWIFTPWFRGTRCRWCEHVLGMMCHRGGSGSGLPRGSFHQHQHHYSLFFQTQLSLLRGVGVLRIV